jgi:hypothetical protein
MDGSGLIYTSRYKSSTAKSIAGRTRELSNKSITPGPGSYSSFSEFGYVEKRYTKKYKEMKEKSIANSPTPSSIERLQLLKKSISNGFLRFKKDKFNRDFESYSNENIDKILKKYSIYNEEEVIFILFIIFIFLDKIKSI